jgi:hypothetical protein
MAATQQMSALGRLQALYGSSGWTHDFIDHRRVGCQGGSKAFMANGQTWTEAIENLKAKVAK